MGRPTGTGRRETCDTKRANIEKSGFGDGAGVVKGSNFHLTFSQEVGRSNTLFLIN
jgi:hypothetical protein